MWALSEVFSLNSIACSVYRSRVWRRWIMRSHYDIVDVSEVIVRRFPTDVTRFADSPG
jgi:hypothetical protein